MNPGDIEFEVGPSNGKPQRAVVAFFAGQRFQDQFNVGSSNSRRRFFTKLGQRAGFQAAELEAVLEERLVELAEKADAQAEADADDATSGDGARKNQATRIMELAACAELWHSPAGDAYATIPVGDHLEHHRLSTRDFKRWLARQYYRAEGTAPGSQAVQDALTVLEGKALYDGMEHPVFVRLAEHEGAIYLDLCNADWQVVEVTRSGWRVVIQAPVRFRRAKAMRPIPTPHHGGSIDELRRFINVSDYDWPLVVAWMVAALRPTGPYPVLCVHGEQGSGKSTQLGFVRALVDPNASPLRSEPREPRDLMIAASNGWVVAMDNISFLHPWLSDCVCRLSTGGGFSTRTLYSDDEETIFDARRPVLLGGIEELATRGDLIDRSIIVNLPRIEDTDRKDEKELMEAFASARPRILGALLTAVAAGLANVDQVHLARRPRMADFATWMSAAEPALPWPRGTFMDCYEGNRLQANSLALEASPVAKVVMELALKREWTGTATELLADLERIAHEKVKQSKQWPSSARALSGLLRRLAPNLRAAGFEVDFASEGRGRNKRRVISIGMMAEPTVPTVPIVPNAGFPEAHGDGGDGDAADGDVVGTQTQDAVRPSEATAGTVGDGGDADLQTHSDDEGNTPDSFEEGEL